MENLNQQNTVELFGREVFQGSVGDFLDALWNDHAIQKVGYFNAHTVNLYHSSAEYKALIDQFDLIYADGMALVVTSQKKKTPIQDRVNAGDFFARFLWKCKVTHKKVALIGSEQQTLETAMKCFGKDGLDSVISIIHNGFLSSGSSVEDNLIERLEKEKPDFIILGMGSPIQEEFALKICNLLPDSKIWCVGALFEYFGSRYRAPVWFRENGLEWVVRLVLEPKRMAKRYLIGNLLYKIREYRELSKKKS